MGNLAAERYRTGNRVQVYTRGPGERKILGEGLTGRSAESSNASLSQNTGARPLYAIGDPNPQGIVDGAYTNRVTISMLELSSRGAADALNADYVDIDIIDKYSGARQTAEECHLVSRDRSVAANNPIQRNLVFEAMRIVG